MNNALDFIFHIHIKSLETYVVFSHLKSMKLNIFLQETQVKTTHHRKHRANWVSHVYQSPFTSKA